MPERLTGFTTRFYINPRYFYLYLLLTKLLDSTLNVQDHLFLLINCKYRNSDKTDNDHDSD